MAPGFDVAYLFEHAARELDVACAVTALLRDNGVRTEVIQWPHGFHRVAACPAPTVVVLPFCYSERSFAPCLLEWRGATYFNMSWEQLFYSGNSKAKSPRGRFATRHVIHHAWSDLYADWLHERGVPPERIFTNGHPAYALYSAPYSGYFDTRSALGERHGLNTARRWIFFPENYNWAFYSAESLRRFKTAGQSDDDIAEMRAYCDASLRQTVHWCAELAATGEMEVIIRPRPATTPADFKRFVEQTLGTLPPHLHIIQDGTVREWVPASDVVVSSHSTTLIEAALAGKPAYMLAPLPMPAALHVHWHDLVEKVSTGNELKELCRGRAHPLHSERLSEWARSQLLSRGDPIRNLANFLTALAAGKLARPPIVPRSDALSEGRLSRYGVPTPLEFELRRWLRPGSRRRASRDLEPEHLPDLAGEREAEARIVAWDQLLNRRSSTAVAESR